MRIAEVIGYVTLSRRHPSFAGAQLKIALPLTWEQLCGGATPSTDETIVVWDELGAGLGSRIALSEGPEASQPFRPEPKAVDAYKTALFDHLNIRSPDEIRR